MPYSPETTSRYMLANIASIELPPVVTSYLDWIQDQSPELLQTYGLDPDDFDNRQFSPRLVLGKYFRVQLLTVIALGSHRLRQHRRDDYQVHGFGQTQAPMGVFPHKCDPPSTTI